MHSIKKSWQKTQPSMLMRIENQMITATSASRFHQSSTQPPALCLNTEEISKMFDEIMGYLIFQRKDMLDDFLSLSFSEMKSRMDERRTPFTRRQFFCPAYIAEDTMLPRAPTKEEYLEWATGDGRRAYQAEREQWMWERWFQKGGSSLLLCDNLEHCYEAIRAHSMIWKLYLWAYTTINVNEFLTPFIAVNSDGVRTICPNSGEGHRGLIISRLRLLYSTALGIKKFRSMWLTRTCPPRSSRMVCTTFALRDFSRHNRNASARTPRLCSSVNTWARNSIRSTRLGT